MSLKEQIVSDMKDAMRAKDTKRLGTIRMLTAAMKQKEVDERIELNDQLVLAIIEKMIKQRKDSITQFEAAGRRYRGFRAAGYGKGDGRPERTSGRPCGYVRSFLTGQEIAGQSLIH